MIRGINRIGNTNIPTDQLILFQNTRERMADRQTDRQTGRQKERQIDRQTDRQTDRDTDGRVTSRFLFFRF